MKKSTGSLVLLTAVAVLLGCGQQQDRQSSRPDEVSNTEVPSGSQYLLASEPQDALGVIDVRQKAQDEEAVVVIGRIGGSKNPCVEGRAAFSIVDLSLKACSDIEGDRCKTPWDYCCEADRAKATVLVKVVDSSGNLGTVDSRELLGVEELQTVVVEGTADRDEAGNLTAVLASGVYLKP